MAAKTKDTARKPTKAPKNASTKSAERPKPAKYPRHTVEKALRIPKAIYDQNAGRPTSLVDAAKFSTGGKVNGPFQVEVSSAKKYGFLRSEDRKLVLEERARKALAPQSETDRISALREAVLAAPDLSNVYNHYRGGNLPDERFFGNALRDLFSIPSDKVSEFRGIFLESVRDAGLIDESGERPTLLDIGRDEAQAGRVTSPRKAMHTAAEGATCFVMQPFRGHLGEYYEKIFKPAIENAGLRAVRADDDIFATGKIMDQVWRGIREATVLVAELTSKNPNVL